MKKIIIGIFSVILTFGTISYADTDWNTEYPWAKTEIAYCINNGILKGDENGNLNLSNNLTQGEMAALITRTFNLTKDTSNGSGIKINSNHWAYNNAIALAGYLAIPSEFNADSNATRGQMASTLPSILGFFDDCDNSYFNLYSDKGNVSQSYVPYIKRALYLDILRGSDSHLNTNGSLKRVEAIAMLYRAIDNQLTIKTPILGNCEVSLEQAISWAKAKNADQRFIDIASIYWKYGALFGIRPEVMYAQAGKETGYGKYTGRVLPEMNNWAGIKKYGATGDATEDHETFSTPDDGVRGHFNHMSAYVGLEPVGIVHGRYYSVKSLSWAGSIKSVEELGGKWCPDRQYGVAIVREINRMKSY